MAEFAAFLLSFCLLAAALPVHAQHIPRYLTSIIEKAKLGDPIAQNQLGWRYSIGRALRRTKRKQSISTRNPPKAETPGRRFFPQQKTDPCFMRLYDLMICVVLQTFSYIFFKI